MTRSTITLTFAGEDMDPGALIASAGKLKAAIDRANDLPPAARIAIAKSPMGAAARELAASLESLAGFREADDPGERAIPPSQPEGVEILVVLDADFEIPLGGGAEPLRDTQKVLWLIKRVRSGELQAHRITGEIKVWAAEPADWEPNANPETDDRWQTIT